MSQNVVSRNSDVMGGTPVFAGTRVPVQNLLDHLKAGDSVSDFLAGYPTVSREQVIAFLEAARDSFLETVRVLLDECVDWRLSRDIAEHHDVRTARQMGWTTIKNGELLRLAPRSGVLAL